MNDNPVSETECQRKEWRPFFILGVPVRPRPKTALENRVFTYKCESCGMDVFFSLDSHNKIKRSLETLKNCNYIPVCPECGSTDVLWSERSNK